MSNNYQPPTVAYIVSEDGDQVTPQCAPGAAVMVAVAVAIWDGGAVINVGAGVNAGAVVNAGVLVNAAKWVNP